MDPEIWARQQAEPVTGFGRVVLVLRHISGIFTHPFSAFLLGTVAIGWSVIATVLTAYYIGGVHFFGPVFLAIWAAIILTGIVAIEKTGYARNFQDWNYSTRHILVLPIGFAAALGVLFLLVFLGHSLH